MRLRVAIFGGIVVVSVVGFGAFVGQPKAVEPPGTLLPTGRYITPIGDSVNVGSYPANMAVSPDGKYIVVTNTGFRQQLSVLDAQTGAMTDKVEFNLGPKGEQLSLYYGLAFGPDGKLYASNGPLDQVSIFDLSADGKLTASGTISDPSGKDNEPYFTAGLAVEKSGGDLVIAHNEAYKSSQLKSTLSIIRLDAKRTQHAVTVAGFPYDVVLCEPSNKDAKIYTTCERDNVVSVVNKHMEVASIRTGMQPTSLLLNRNQDRLYVSNSGSDTISIIDTNTDKVVKTILARPAALRGLPGTTPLGLTLSGDEKTLYVALANLNAVGVIDLQKNSVVGYIPVGWYPTAVAVVGNNLFVANGKGTRGLIPNGKLKKGDDSYIQNIIEGTVSKIDLAQVQAQLQDLSQQALMSNFAMKGAAQARAKDFKNPGIKHVIYILKENRTYDQILGDDSRGNGDASLTMYGKDVTPNEHALADRFVLLDDFSVCAEVSGDGWQWSTAGMASEYTSRNVPFNYSGRGRDYDFEGQTNGVAPDYVGMNDVADVPGGYIWNACLRQHISMRNYGFYVDPIDKNEAKAGGIEIAENGPTKKALVKDTDDSFRQFDMHYADSDLWDLYHAPSPKLLKNFGDNNAISRFTEWKHEFDKMVATGKMPQFMMVRFCRDHTAGTTPDLDAPQAMVADNDYAVGQLVDAVSHSPFWKDTAIFIFEDDAQAGQDHIDCHRSTAYVISPFVHPGLVDSRFYNTDSALRTMELLLGLKPMNQYDATANPLMVFDDTPANSEPYHAVMPSREIATAVNTPKAYRAADSAKLISWYKEESLPDLELNDILWHAAKGNVLPKTAAINRSPVPLDRDGD